MPNADPVAAEAGRGSLRRVREQRRCRLPLACAGSGPDHIAAVHCLSRDGEGSTQSVHPAREDALVTTDQFDLQRFIDAQNRGGSYDGALRELRAGQKRGHWIWWVFPQLRGLGMSENSTHYGLDGLAEAQAYLAHPVLGPRLHEAAQALLDQPERDAVRVLGSIDATKLRSSMTLFAEANPKEAIFTDVLDAFFAGELDEKTLEILQK